MTQYLYGADSIVLPVSFEGETARPGVARMSRLRARGRSRYEAVTSGAGTEAGVGAGNSVESEPLERSS